MAPLQDTTTTTTTLATGFRWPSCRRIFLRKRKLPMVRLGARKRRRGFFIVRMMKKMRLRWIKLQYRSMLKRLKLFYSNLVKDIMESGSSFEGIHQRILMEASFTIPVMGVSFTSFPSMPSGSHLRHRSFMIM